MALSPADSQLHVDMPQAVAKRTRIPLACNTCRHQKSRCDGKRPECSSCKELSTNCEYTEVSEYVRSKRRLESRDQLVQKVKELEAQLHRNTADTSPSTSSTGMPVLIDDAATSNCPANTEAPQEQQQQQHGPPDDSVLVELDDESAVDILATATFNRDSELHSGHFGPSSNHALFRSILDPFSQTINHELSGRRTPVPKRIRQPTTNHLSDNSFQQGSTSRISHKAALVLPSEAETTFLFDQYFATLGVVLPFVARSAVKSEFHRLSRSINPGLSAGRSLLNIIFAHVATFLGTNECHVYYNRALASLSERRLRGTSIELIQALLLTAVYQQNHQQSVSSWTYHALAVKAAFQLGLHSPVTYREYGLQDCELRKRLWYGIILQDRLLCASLGRPFLVPVQYICTTKPLDPRATLRTTSSIDPKYVEGLMFYNQLISLYEILGSVIEQSYNHNIETDTFVSEQTLFPMRLKLYWELENWCRDLPRGFDVISAQDAQNLLLTIGDANRFRLILSTHYYRTVLITNAPVLIRILNEMVSPRKEQSNFDWLLENALQVIKSNFIATKSLHSIIHTIITLSNVFVDQNNVWWLCNYTILTVCLHLFGTLLICHVCSEPLSAVGLTTTELRQCLDQSIRTMKSVQRSSLMSRKARECLNGFLEVFDSVTCEIQPTSAFAGSTDAANLLDLAVMDGTVHDDFGLFVTQTANDFLAQFNQSNFLGDDLSFFVDGST